MKISGPTMVVGEVRMMSGSSAVKGLGAAIMIRVSGRLFQGHLSYVDQLVESAGECGLWPLLSLGHVEELDRAAILYLIHGAGRDFGLADCPNFIREWMEHERERIAAEAAA